MYAPLTFDLDLVSKWRRARSSVLLAAKQSIDLPFTDCKCNQTNFHRGYYPLLPLFKIHFVFPTPVSRLSAKRWSRWDARLSNVSVIFMPVPQKVRHPSVVVLLSLLSLSSWWLWWFSQPFQWFLCLKHTMIRRSGRPGRRKNNKWPYTLLLRHTHAVRSRAKAERGKSFSTSALSKQKWTVRYLAVSANTLGLNISF